MSSNRSVGYFLQEHTTLFPTNTLIPDIKDEDWVVDLKKYFDDLLYQYYYNRIIFYDEDKYPIHDETTSYNNIRKTISIMLNTKAYTYGKLWESTQLEYNPIWNVDGVTETDRELKQTGTDENARSGSDTSADSGSDVTTGQVTTYDTSFLDKDKSTLQHGLTNTTTFGSKNTETRNLKDVEAITVTRQGNIGVTTTQQMLDAERQTVQFDVLKFIVHDIVNQFTYGVY